MAEEGQEDHALDDLKDLVTQTLDGAGVLNRIKAEMRANVFLALDQQGHLPKPSQRLPSYLNSRQGAAVFSLTCQLLDAFGLKFTRSVLEAEAGLQSYQLPEVDAIADELGLSQPDNGQPWLSAVYSRALHADQVVSSVKSRDTSNVDPDLLQKARAAFDRYDENNNGLIEKSELRSLFQSLFPRFPPNMLERYLNDEFSAADVDMSSTIDFQEFLGLYQRLIVRDTPAGLSSAQGVVDRRLRAGGSNVGDRSPGSFEATRSPHSRVADTSPAASPRAGAEMRAPPKEVAVAKSHVTERHSAVGKAAASAETEPEAISEVASEVASERSFRSDRSRAAESEGDDSLSNVSREALRQDIEKLKMIDRRIKDLAEQEKSAPQPATSAAHKESPDKPAKAVAADYEDDFEAMDGASFRQEFERSATPVGYQDDFEPASGSFIGEDISVASGSELSKTPSVRGTDQSFGRAAAGSDGDGAEGAGGYDDDFEPPSASMVDEEVVSEIFSASDMGAQDVQVSDRSTYSGFDVAEEVW